jgi:hypothetical protein
LPLPPLCGCSTVYSSRDIDRFERLLRREDGLLRSTCCVSAPWAARCATSLATYCATWALSSGGRHASFSAAAGGVLAMSGSLRIATRAGATVEAASFPRLTAAAGTHSDARTASCPTGTAGTAGTACWLTKLALTAS